jgi:hypothetical protein
MHSYKRFTQKTIFPSFTKQSIIIALLPSHRAEHALKQRRNELGDGVKPKKHDFPATKNEIPTRARCVDTHINLSNEIPFS